MAGITFPKEIIKQKSEKKSKCDDCKKKDICKYSKDLLELESKIDELEIIDVFKIEVSCRYFVHIDNTRYSSGVVMC